MSNTSNGDLARLLQGRGWSLTKHGSGESDPQVIRLQRDAPLPLADNPFMSFYDAMNNGTFRKVLSIIFTHRPCRKELLLGTCDEKRLDQILAYLQVGGVIVSEGDSWTVSDAFRGINNIGTTFEWYVAQWFRNDLHVPSHYGVKLAELRIGRDLDVVAFVSDIFITVECKAGAPNNIDETQIRWFLQHAFDFFPDIAILLIDTAGSIEKPVRMVDKVWSEMSWLDRCVDDQTLKNSPPTAGPPTPSLPSYDGLYWCAPNVFVANVTVNLNKTFSQLFRAYDRFVRRALFRPIYRQWDFVNGQVSQEKFPAITVNGMVVIG